MVSGTSSQGYTYKDLAKHISAYLCGHLHRLVAGISSYYISCVPVIDNFVVVYKAWATC